MQTRWSDANSSAGEAVGAAAESERCSVARSQGTETGNAQAQHGRDCLEWIPPLDNSGVPTDEGSLLQTATELGELRLRAQTPGVWQTDRSQPGLSEPVPSEQWAYCPAWTGQPQGNITAVGAPLQFGLTPGVTSTRLQHNIACSTSGSMDPGSIDPEGMVHQNVPGVALQGLSPGVQHNLSDASSGETSQGFHKKRTGEPAAEAARCLMTASHVAIEPTPQAVRSLMTASHVAIEHRGQGSGQGSGRCGNATSSNSMLHHLPAQEQAAGVPVTPAQVQQLQMNPQMLQKQGQDLLQNLTPARQQGQTQARARISVFLAEDGQSWIKYGEKQLMYPRRTRAYFKCAEYKDKKCAAKKVVDFGAEDPMGMPPTITYHNHHNHALPEKNAMSKRKGTGLRGTRSGHVISTQIRVSPPAIMTFPVYTGHLGSHHPGKCALNPECSGHSGLYSQAQTSMMPHGQTYRSDHILDSPISVGTPDQPERIVAGTSMRWPTFYPDTGVESVAHLNPDQTSELFSPQQSQIQPQIGEHSIDAGSRTQGGMGQSTPPISASSFPSLHPPIRAGTLTCARQGSAPLGETSGLCSPLQDTLSFNTILPTPPAESHAPVPQSMQIQGPGPPQGVLNMDHHQLQSGGPLSFQNVSLPYPGTACNQQPTALPPPRVEGLYYQPGTQMLTAPPSGSQQMARTTFMEPSAYFATQHQTNAGARGQGASDSTSHGEGNHSHLQSWAEGVPCIPQLQFQPGQVPVDGRLTPNLAVGCPQALPTRSQPLPQLGQSTMLSSVEVSARESVLQGKVVCCETQATQTEPALDRTIESPMSLQYGASPEHIANSPGCPRHQSWPGSPASPAIGFGWH